MRNAKIISTSLTVNFLFATLQGCTPESNSVDDVADQVGKALDPAPDYVDQPAAEPKKPQ